MNQIGRKKIEKVLDGFSKEKLTCLVTNLLDELEETDRTNFISRHISAKIALEEIGEVSTELFLSKLHKFCESCLTGDFYIEPDEEEFDYDEFYRSSQWAENFYMFLRKTGMFLQSKDYNVAFKAYEEILYCLHVASQDESILGAELPMKYIEIDWEEVFDFYFLAMKENIPNQQYLIDKALEIWIRFGEICTKPILTYVNNISLVEKSIRKLIEKEKEWDLQHALYNLLKGFYAKNNQSFDTIKIAQSLIEWNKNFYFDLVEGYFISGQWDKVIQSAKEALAQIDDPEIVFDLEDKLVGAYERLAKFDLAFDVAKKMLFQDETINNYVRARYFAEKTDIIKAFQFEILSKLKLHQSRFQSIPLLLQILSYEGQTETLVQTVIRSSGYERHDYMKYVVKSLLFRAIEISETQLTDLSEFLTRIKQKEIDGIVNMRRLALDDTNKEMMLFSAIDLLKKMIQFHVDGACRDSYQEAAYYCAVLRDVYKTLNKVTEFNAYYSILMKEKFRLRALKDEMKMKLGLR